jgi:mRNA interferase RelE/StbE
VNWSPWSVEWDERAADDLEDLSRRDSRLARRIRQAVTTYAMTGHGDVRKLRGHPDRWRQRIGTWRVIFTFQRTPRTLLVLSVTPRRDAYRD